jgi:hypothetical protein
MVQLDRRGRQGEGTTGKVKGLPETWGEEVPPRHGRLGEASGKARWPGMVGRRRGGWEGRGRSGVAQGPHSESKRHRTMHRCVFLLCEALGRTIRKQASCAVLARVACATSACEVQLHGDCRSCRGTRCNPPQTVLNPRQMASQNNYPAPLSHPPPRTHPALGQSGEVCGPAGSTDSALTLAVKFFNRKRT